MARTFVSLDADEDTFPSDEIHTYGKAVEGWCEAIHAAPAAHPGVRDIRWRTAEDDDDWASTPG